VSAFLLAEPAADVAELEQLWCHVPGGSFVMGDPAGRPDEQPPHEVTIAAFEAAAVPVTNRLYGQFLAATRHEPPRFWGDARFNAPDQPVTGVNWYDAVAYCHWLTEASGRIHRLPSEAEREKLSLGGLQARYPWGDADPPFEGPLARGTRGQDRPLPVGRMGPNGYGLYDTAYNVHEWCSDWYEPTYYASAPANDPRGPATGFRRASRGGAWRHEIKVTRCAARSSLNPQLRYNDYGLRAVRTL
jgi:formylglycine-generating enzyme required for sulfatase activity